MKFLKFTLLGIIAFILLISVAGYFVLQQPQFGQKPMGVNLEKIKESPQHNGKIFENAGNIEMDMTMSKFIEIMKAYMEDVQGKIPESLPILHPDLNIIENTSDTITALTWFGHSAFLLEMDGKKIVLDPMLGPAAAPFTFQVNRFSDDLPIGIEDLPKIDAVIFSHDHYDHLDYHTIMRIKDRVSQYYVPLGLGSHLIHWGIEEEKIIELDWWQEVSFDGIQLACTPSQHFSGRALNDRASTLWCSWVIEGKKSKVFFSGDSGYFPGFKKIGEKYGPFDLAMVECGQYNKLWHEIHMLPEESAQAAVDLNAEIMMPIHWAMFELSLHPWKEPVERLSLKAAELNLPIFTPKIGERFTLGAALSSESWCENLN